MVFLQPMHQVPDAGLIPLVTVNHSVVIEHLDLVQQLHQPLPDFRMAQDVVKNIAAESRNRRIRCQAHHHPAEQRLLLGLRRHFLRQRVHAQVVPAFLRNLPVCHFILPGKQYTQLRLLHDIILI